MINIFEVNETNKMIEQENLDVRTITMGISLLDCIDSDLDIMNEKIYNKITTKAKDLVATGECDFLLLDEILGLMDKGIAPVETIIDMLKQKDESMHIVMTGRWLPEALKPYVDSVTTMTTELTGHFK